MFVKYHLDSRLLEYTLSSASDVDIAVEKFDSSPSVPLRVTFWANGESFDAFETALDDDPTVAARSVLVSDPSQRLYCVVATETEPCVDLYVRSVELDGVVLDASVDGGGWSIEMLFPDRDAFATYREACEAAGLSVTVESIHDDDIDRTSADADLTPAQREILSRAIEVGYFDIPRKTTLRGLGDEVGVSGQAASERLRRGMETLVRSTLIDDFEE